MKNPDVFLDSFFEQILAAGIDIANYDLDHIAYQASSSQDYETLLPEFKSQGKQVSEEMVGERRVAVFRLSQPIIYKTYSIPALELIEPRKGQLCNSAFQHAEFVLDIPFEQYIAKYPNINWDKSSMDRDEFAHLKLNFDNRLTLKFLRKPILQAIAEKVR